MKGGEMKCLDLTEQDQWALDPALDGDRAVVSVSGPAEPEEPEAAVSGAGRVQDFAGALLVSKEALAGADRAVCSQGRKRTPFYRKSPGLKKSSGPSKTDFLP